MTNNGQEPKIRVLIAEDHTIVRTGVRLLLETQPDMEVVGEALNGEEALSFAKSLQPDIILMDIAMPVLDGLDATRKIKHHWPEIHVLVLTMHRSDEYFFEMLKAGASGYILKAAGTSELLNAIRVVVNGEVFLYPSMAKKLLHDYLYRMEDGLGTAEDLTPREKEILILVANGYSNKEIAEKLVVSQSTVHTHRSNLMEKLGLSNRRELMKYAQKQGLISSLDEWE